MPRCEVCGRITALALDPIEKKPLRRFMPGSRILSVGSYGCNLRCPFCQNHEISWSQQAMQFADTAEFITPDELAAAAERYRARGNVGVAFTYNEPLVGYEYVRDTAKLVQEAGMVNVLVSKVMRFIARAVQFCHVELTTLIIPGENDTEEEMREMCTWIASLRGIAQGSEIPLHISRFFPRFHMTDRAATDVAKVYKLADVAREKLSYVYTGNC